MVLNSPAVEICGYPTSRGFRLTPSRPTRSAKSTPAFRLCCPPSTDMYPKRSSFSLFRPIALV